MYNLQSILDEVEQYENYILTNTDYTSNYDVLLADDSSYHDTVWRDAILNALGVAAINEQALDHLITTIIENPAGYCNIKVVSVYTLNKYAVASFPISEEEYQLAGEYNLTSEQIEWLNSESDYHFTQSAGAGTLAYIYMEDSAVVYELNPRELQEAHYTYLHNESVD